jgi:hypothetical protein
VIDHHTNAVREMGRHRRLTLAPQPWLSPAIGNLESGSRFSCLVSGDDSGGEMESGSVARDVAMRALDKDLVESPVSLQPSSSKEVLVQARVEKRALISVGNRL